MKKNIFIVAGLLLSVGSVSCSQTQLDQQLINAAQNNNVELVNTLLKKGASVNATSYGYTALASACMYGYTPIVVALLAAPGINVNATSYGYTALTSACMYGYTPIVVALLAAPGINVNVVDSYGYTALTSACMHGYTPIVAALLATPGIIVSSYDVRLAKKAADSNKTMKSIYRLINSAYNAPNLTQWQSDHKQNLQTLKNQ